MRQYNFKAILGSLLDDLSVFSFMGKRNYNRTSEEVEQKAFDLYQSGLSSIKVGEILGLSYTTVLEIQRRKGVQPRTWGESHRKYTFNHNFFEEIDSHEKAYWLGFIVADGNVCREKDLNIGLSGKDECHLQSFIRSIDGNNYYKVGLNMGFNKESPFCKLSIRSIKLVSDLKALGVMANKTSTCQPPTIPEEFENSFWLGVIDGDGCLCISCNLFTIELVGNQFILDGFRLFVEKRLNITLRREIHKSIYRVRTSGTKAAKICELLYLNSPIFLDRKRQKFLAYKKQHE